MNATIESLFGPPSEPIDIPAFIDAAVAVVDANSDEPSLDVEACDVSDIREDLFRTWNNPRLSAHLSTNHEQHLLTLTKSAKSKRKTQKPSTLSTDVMALQDSLDAVKLSCWKYEIHQHSFEVPKPRITTSSQELYV
ncbi:hypothetical protein H0H93_008418 [Arthromyces matolae]|nr:hypothetical protein H0H93_008418 [Arthromyces matolae]